MLILNKAMSTFFETIQLEISELVEKLVKKVIEDLLWARSLVISDLR